MVRWMCIRLAKMGKQVGLMRVPILGIGRAARALHFDEASSDEATKH